MITLCLTIIMCSLSCPVSSSNFRRQRDSYWRDRERENSSKIHETPPLTPPIKRPPLQDCPPVGGRHQLPLPRLARLRELLRGTRWSRGCGRPSSMIPSSPVLPTLSCRPLPQLVGPPSPSTTATTENPRNSFAIDPDQTGTAQNDMARTVEPATQVVDLSVLRCTPRQFTPPPRLILYPPPHPPHPTLSPRSPQSHLHHPLFITSRAARSGPSMLLRRPRASNVAPPLFHPPPPLIKDRRPKRHWTSPNSIPFTPSICLPQLGPARSWDGAVPDSTWAFGCVMCTCACKSV